MAPPVASWRTHPVTVTSPRVAAGSVGRSAPELSVSIQPRSTSTAAPSAVTSGVTTSTPGPSSRVWYFSTMVCRSSYLPWTVTRCHSEDAAGPRRVDITVSTGTGAEARLVAVTRLVCLRSCRRWNCHCPSTTAR